MSWDFSWIWPLMYAVIVIMLVSMTVSMFLKLLGFFPKRKDARRDNESINREVFKELSKSAKINKIRRIKDVYIKPSKHQLPKRLGRYKGHIPDPRVLILRIKVSRVPFSRHMLLFVPYQLMSKETQNALKYPVSMPLTVKNIELYIEGVVKYGYWYLPVVRKDSPISQEEVDLFIARYINTHTSVRYLVQELPPEGLKAPVYGASVPPQVEQRIQVHMPKSDKEEEREVAE